MTMRNQIYGKSDKKRINITDVPHHAIVWRVFLQMKLVI